MRNGEDPRPAVGRKKNAGSGTLFAGAGYVALAITYYYRTHPQLETYTLNEDSS